MPNFESYPQNPAFRPHSELHDVDRTPTWCLFKIPFNIIRQTHFLVQEVAQRQ